jgi:hypothetical protein
MVSIVGRAHKKLRHDVRAPTMPVSCSVPDQQFYSPQRHKDHGGKKRLQIAKYEMQIENCGVSNLHFSISNSHLGISGLLDDLCVFVVNYLCFAVLYPGGAVDVRSMLISFLPGLTAYFSGEVAWSRNHSGVIGFPGAGGKLGLLLGTEGSLATTVTVY